MTPYRRDGFAGWTLQGDDCLKAGMNPFGILDD